MKSPLILATVFFLNASVIFCSEINQDMIPNVVDVDKNVEKTNIYINENGALVDETLTRDTKNEILILHVPAHHDRAEAQVVFDENSDWMMTIIPLMEICEVMKKPPMLSIEKEAFGNAKSDNSTPVRPIKISSRKTKTVEIKLNTIIGYNFTHELLPKKFQSLCPSHYTPYTTRMVLEGENPALYPVTYEADLYDFVPGLSTASHPRVRRGLSEKMKCIDHNQNPLPIKHCDAVYGNKCDYGQCTAEHTIYSCHYSPTNICWYFTVPCSKLPKDPEGDDWDNCMTHTSNSNQRCSACCRNQSCGKFMDKCVYNQEYGWHNAEMDSK